MHFRSILVLSQISLAVSSSLGLNRCEEVLHSLQNSTTFPNTTLLSTSFVAKGSYNVSTTYNAHSFCNVTGQQKYGTSSTLNFQVWLPDTPLYQGRFMAVGNGGMAGIIDFAAMVLNLNKGFAVAGGDAGHLAANNNKGGGAPNTYLPYLHSPDEITAWIHNAIALFTVPAKAVVEKFYGKAAKYNFYNGCSTGGAQGFALAQYHPDLFDGIIAGSPGNWYSHLALSFLWNARVSQNFSYIPQEKLNLITQAVLEECDELDGIKDRLLENPLACSFNISSLACEGSVSNTSTCLTASQIVAAQAIYSGPRYTMNGTSIYPGFDFGSETEWAQQEGPLSSAFAVPLLQNLIYKDLSYDATAFNFETDVPAVDLYAGTYIDEISTNLTAFKNHGGKLIVTQGWADAYNAATWPIQHLEDITEFFDGSRAVVSDFINLFMVPGGGHCGGAPGYPGVPAVLHTTEKLVQWVERGSKPEWVLSTSPADGSDTTRLLCPWPQTARYVAGDAKWWGSYVCEG